MMCRLHAPTGSNCLRVLLGAAARVLRYSSLLTQGPGTVAVRYPNFEFKLASLSDPALIIVGHGLIGCGPIAGNFKLQQLRVQLAAEPRNKQTVTAAASLGRLGFVQLYEIKTRPPCFNGYSIKSVIAVSSTLLGKVGCFDSRWQVDCMMRFARFITIRIMAIGSYL